MCISEIRRAIDRAVTTNFLSKLARMTEAPQGNTEARESWAHRKKEGYSERTETRRDITAISWWDQAVEL